VSTFAKRLDLNDPFFTWIFRQTINCNLTPSGMANRINRMQNQRLIAEVVLAVLLHQVCCVDVRATGLPTVHGHLLAEERRPIP